MRWDVIRRKQSTFLTIANAIDTVSLLYIKTCHRNAQNCADDSVTGLFTIYYKAAFPLNTLISNINSKAVQKSCDVIIMLMTSNNGRRRQSSLRSVRVRKRNRF